MSLTHEVSPTNQTLLLRDGRTLGYAEYGSAEVQIAPGEIHQKTDVHILGNYMLKKLELSH